MRFLFDLDMILRFKINYINIEMYKIAALVARATILRLFQYLAYLSVQITKITEFYS